MNAYGERWLDRNKKTEIEYMTNKISERMIDVPKPLVLFPS